MWLLYCSFLSVFNWIAENGKYKSYNLGRISVVYNVAGKSRLIGITNYWIQVALEPLHSSIMKFLKDLPTDGTYDQLKPIHNLSGKEGLQFSSLDLSAATDRLPLSLQRQVISIFTSPKTANLWVDLIRFPLGVKGFEDVLPGVNEVNYTVGQPMGAYSSWASLALTHHVIVQASSDDIAQDYAILGDDVVIEASLTDKYIHIIKSLGVEIQMTKSLIRDKFVEFAKRVIDLREAKAKDLSILGPKLIIGSIKNPIFKVRLLLDCFVKEQLREYQVLNKLTTLSTKNWEYMSFGLWALYGVNGFEKINRTSRPFKLRQVRLVKSSPKTLSLRDMPVFDMYGFLVQNRIDIYSSYYILVTKKYFEIANKALVDTFKIFLYLESSQSIRSFIRNVLLLLSPYAWVVVSHNLHVWFKSLNQLYELYHSQTEGYEGIEELGKLLHPTFASIESNELEKAKSELEMIRKLTRLIKRREKIDISKGLLRDQVYRRLVPELYNDKV